MLKRPLSLLFLLSAPMLFGQLDSNSVTVTANQSQNLQADQVLFAIGVTAPFSASLDDVLAAVKGVGITSSNFSGVNSGSAQFNGTGTVGPQSAAQWSFALAVPFSQMKTTITALTSLQKSIGQSNPGFSLSFNVQGTQVSAALQQAHTCNLTSLIADAITQAQKLASAAGLNLGSILAMSSVAPNEVPTAVTAVGFVNFVSQPLAVLNCALTVKFGLTRF